MTSTTTVTALTCNRCNSPLDSRRFIETIQITRAWDGNSVRDVDTYECHECGAVAKVERN